MNHAAKHLDSPLIKSNEKFLRTDHFRVIDNNPRDLSNLHKSMLEGKTIRELIGIKT